MKRWIVIMNVIMNSVVGAFALAVGLHDLSLGGLWVWGGFGLIFLALMNICLAFQSVWQHYWSRR